MKYSNAIKKLKKNGFTVKEDGEGQVWATIGNREVDFFCNGKFSQDGEICCIRTRALSDKDDVMTDYSAGVFCDNLSQAIRLASR
jgi:hypothetical protein